MKKIEIKQGDRYGKLSIVKELEKQSKRRSFLCKCECGNEKIIQLNHLRCGSIISCGCEEKKNRMSMGDKFLIHGKSKTPEYETWCNMKQRCYNIKNKRYNDWGGRGIKVCDRWLNSFTNFYEDMGKRPKNYTIDRIDNDGNYEPNNCKWATISEQMKNRRKFKNRII
jgi:hypothetical protein